MTVTKDAFTFELFALAPTNGILSGLFKGGNPLPMPADFVMTDAIINEAMRLPDSELGPLAQLYVVLSTEADDVKKLREGVRRIIVAGLKHEAESTLLVDEIKKYNLPQLSGLSGFSFRYLLKCYSLNGMVALAGSLSAPPVVLRQLLSYIRAASESNNGTGTWSKFHTDYDFDLEGFRNELAALFAKKGIDPVLIAKQWDSTATVNQPTSVNLTPTQGATPVTAATKTPIASALISVNPALKPVIDGVLSQAGVPMSIDQIVQEVQARSIVEQELEKVRKDAEDTITQLRKTLANASSMQPVAIAATSATIPSGKVDWVEAETIFPLMKGYSLKVPCFTWDHAHPDVPAVNQDYIFRKEMLLKALRCLARNENFWCQGHTGSGKTTFIEQIAARLGWPVIRVAFDSNVDRSELVGRMQLTADGKGGTDSNWLHGALERAYSGNYILLCDELDAGHPNALYTMQPMLEHKPLLLLEDGGRVVLKSALNRIVATGNTTGNGDPSGLYPACRILSAATLDRFQEFIHVPYMTVDEESKLITNSVPGLAKAIVQRLAKFANELRVAFVKGEFPVSYSPRRSVAFARAVDDFTNMGIKDQKTVLSLAFKSKLYDAAGEEYRQRITEIANASLGGVDPTITL